MSKNCPICQTDFIPKRQKQETCSYSCSNTFRCESYKKKPICKCCGIEFYRVSPSKGRIFCSKACETTHKRKDHVTIECQVCKKEMLVSPAKRNKKFCSRKCMGVDYSKRQITHSPQYRSYGECAIIVLLEKNYPNLKIIRNDRIQLNGYELDIWIPELNTGIEYNGQHHFKPVYGEKVFLKTQEADKNKRHIANIKQIKLIDVNHLENGRSKKKLIELFKECTYNMGIDEPKIFDFSVNEVKNEQGKCKIFGSSYNKGKKMSLETKGKMLLSRLKKRHIKSPDGKIIEIFNLKEFCKNNNLNYGPMKEAFRKGKLHKGWELIKPPSLQF